MPENNTFRIQNRYLPGLAAWLQSLSLAPKESRERTRFVSLLQERLNESQQVLKGIQEKYGKKKKDSDEVEFGKNRAKADKEWQEYLKEEYVIDVLEGNKEKVKVVKELVLNPPQVRQQDGTYKDYEFSGELAEVYDVWANAFEAVNV